MADIKTRDAVKGTIKTIDKAAIASERMKSAYVEIKERAEQGYYADENSATEYAADRISYAADRVKDEGIHQFNKQGQKAVKTTQENIGKAKDKISDFKQSRAVKAAEQKAIQNMSEQHGLQIRHGVASRSTASDVSQTAKSQLIKTRQQGRKMIKTTARNAEKAVKSTAKGTVKTTEKGIKTAQASLICSISIGFSTSAEIRAAFNSCTPHSIEYSGSCIPFGSWGYLVLKLPSAACMGSSPRPPLSCIITALISSTYSGMPYCFAYFCISGV